MTKREYDGAGAPATPEERAAAVVEIVPCDCHHEECDMARVVIRDPATPLMLGLDTYVRWDGEAQGRHARAAVAAAIADAVAAEREACAALADGYAAIRRTSARPDLATAHYELGAADSAEELAGLLRGRGAP